MWCVAELDEEYIARMEDVLAVYEKPLLAREPVVCIDEKPVVLHQEVRPPVALRPGRVARRDGEYKRCGTANVFCGVQPKAGRHFTKVTNDRSSPEFADYLLDLAAGYPEADTIHLVMDNLSSHTRQAVVERFGAEAGEWLWNRFTVHYTPKHGSWLNQAEIAISLFSRQCLGRRRIGDRPALRKRIVPSVFTPVLAKHSKSFSLIDCISVGVDRMQRNFDPMRKQVEAWQRSELTDVTAKVVICPTSAEMGQCWAKAPNHPRGVGAPLSRY